MTTKEKKKKIIQKSTADKKQKNKEFRYQVDRGMEKNVNTNKLF